MDFQFILPRNNRDLLNSDGNNYFVKQIYNTDEIPHLLRVAKQAFQSSDAFYIFDHFATFVSVIENVSKMQMSQLMRAIELLYNTTEKLGKMLDVYLKKNSFDEQSGYLNLTKMVMYLLVNTVRGIDIFMKTDHSTAASAGGRKNKKATNGEENENFTNWDERRYTILVQVFNLMQLPLEKLWSMSIAEEEFVNMICDLGYRTLTHNSIKEKRVNDAVFQLFGTAIKQYNHAIAFPLQIVQIIEREEIAVGPIANGIRLLHEEFGITSVLGLLLTEFIDKLNVANPCAMTAKHLSIFLTQVFEPSPSLAIQHLSSISQELLNLEPYVIRNSVFGIMGDVIIKKLSAETLDEEQKEVRDYFLEDLLNHINDINSYVRSKVLQIWNEMKNKDAVPLVWYMKVIRTAIERLEDKTATVRKNAISLLKSFLETNPFAAKLPLQELEAEYETVSNGLEVIRAKMNEQESKRDEVNNDFQVRCIPALLPILKQLLSEENVCDSIDTADDNSDAEERVSKIRSLLRNSEFEEVGKIIIKLDVVNQEGRKEMPVEEQAIYFTVLLNSYLFNDYAHELDEKTTLLGFFSDSLEFSKMISLAVPKMEELLISKTNTDVFEAIEFFKTGYLFNIKDTESGMRSMLSLLWTTDKEKRNAVTKAYHSVLFQTDVIGRAHSLKVVDNLFHFFQRISVGEYTAFEKMIHEWIESNEIDATIIQVFYERFTLKLPNTSEELSRCCLEFLILASAVKSTIVSANQNLILEIGLGKRGEMDSRIFAGSLQLLMNAIQPSTTPYFPRYDESETVDKIIEIFKKTFFYTNVPEFELVATRVLSFIYQMCQKPDLRCQSLLLDLCKKLKEISDQRKEKLMEATTGDVQPSQAIEMYIPDFLLRRIIFTYGFIASKELIFLDIDIYNNMKYREDLKREKKDLKNKTNKRKSHISKLNASASEALKRLSHSTTESNQQDQEEMLVGATAEDGIAEMVHQICENELICSPNGMLHSFVPILMEILSHPAKYCDQHTQRAACVTLMRFMAVSGIFCNEQIPFLMNVLKKTKSSQIKRNILIGLTDFTCRFPNVIEPWTSNLYSTLLESDDDVRLTAVKMLSYLILQEMIRVRGQLSYMAICIVDPNQEIQMTTKEFFKEIAHKGNILYNVLPDIVSRLSSNTLPLEETKFRIIMKHIMGLIQKDRQVESLVEKLCLRFRTTALERQWRDIAYCLSLLNHTEKTLKKLIENVPNLKEKIQSDEVLDCFKTIISNANKQVTKVELKNVAKELDTKLQECLKINENGAENGPQPTNSQTESERERVSEEPLQPLQNLKKNRGPKIAPKQKQNNQRFANSSESEDDDFEEPVPLRSSQKKRSMAPNTSTASSRSTRRTGRVQRTVVESDTEDDSDDEEQNPKTRQRRK